MSDAHLTELGPREMATRRCPQCQTEITGGEPCPNCLLELGLAPADEKHPDRIGPYEIVEVLGKGGMGIVYLAEQTEPVRRRVALKVVKRGMESSQVVARFATERQALAMMDHPAIAKVYDAGVAPDGRSYFVMERVEGVPITDYCDRHRLANRQRLDLFRRVCDGVQHAHRRGIIHRDLKPSNILVSTVSGAPRSEDHRLRHRQGHRSEADRGNARHRA